ncbi:hypothetical protein NLO413_0490 [Candidatus Neoehrlichia lotoris str. RAC413]|uniref:Uncharacterized protein n=1 Tax=Candidatus Neoehrlichia procyonis str. RAC413 TaxID=1359163 RepID=A0A0F3NQF4_9RICK|nr:hypothetical protein NLO413_0490 [Candidatus Neoehrlichia lotoris str. RAC413]
MYRTNNKIDCVKIQALEMGYKYNKNYVFYAYGEILLCNFIFIINIF